MAKQIMLEEESVPQPEREKTIMQKYLLYRKGLRMADIDQNDVKSDARRALSNWIVCERIFLDETEEREAFTFRFVEMRGYKEGYEGSCYWVSFAAPRPYVKKERIPFFND
jgi:hypothetical protein